MSQNVLILAGGVFLIYQIVLGWRRGLARCAVRLAALIGAYFVGLYFGTLCVPFLRGIFPYPDFVILCAVGLLVGGLVYFAIWLASVILLKKTAHQKSGAIRFLYGLGGGVIGCIFGLLILWGVISFCRAFGAYAESRTDPSVKNRKSVPVLERQLINIKDALEGGTAGKMVEKVDIIPTSIYQMIVKAGQVTADPQAADRFVQYPPVQRLMQTPRMAAILEDPEVNNAALDRNYLALMRNKNVVAALNDAEFRKAIAEFDFLGALDYALKKPSPKKPPPAPVP